MNGPPRAMILSVPHGTSAGNMLRAGRLLDQLRKADPALRVHLLSPLVQDETFVNEFSSPGVRMTDLPGHIPAGLEARLFALTQASYLATAPTESVRIRYAEARANGSLRWPLPKWLIGRFLIEPFTRRGSRYALSDRLISHPEIERLFDEIQPVLVVTANPGLVFSEVPLLRTAKRRGVRSMAIDPSWDNFTNKLVPVRHVDRLVVWNDIIKDQAVRFHGYAPEAITVAGVPQFDLHFRHDARSPREAFFRRIGADPSRRLITLTTTPRSLYSDHDSVLRALVKGMADGAFAEPCQVLVRLHPRDEVDAYREFAGLPNVIIEKPFRETVRVADGLAVDVQIEHQRHLGDTLCYSDVVVNVASTISIEACIFDTPVVNICFDAREDVDYVRSARRYYAFTHYVNITSRSAVRVAHSPAEMVQWVARYLQEPALDAEGRRQVVREQCQFSDGQSAARVVNAVLAELESVGGRKAAA